MTRNQWINGIIASVAFWGSLVLTYATNGWFAFVLLFILIVVAVFMVGAKITHG